MLEPHLEEDHEGDSWQVPAGLAQHDQEDDQVEGDEGQADVGQVAVGGAQGGDVGPIGVVQLVHMAVQGLARMHEAASHRPLSLSLSRSVRCISWLWRCRGLHVCLKLQQTPGSSAGAGVGA